MTAESHPLGPAAMSAGPSVHIDLFLIMGQFPDLDPAGALLAAIDYAVAAEAAGYDAVWLAEHHFITYGACPSAMAFAPYLLGATSTIMIGTAAVILSNRHPVAVAEEAIMHDNVRPGRFALGVARGGPWVDLEVFGTGRDRWATGFPESLDLVLRALHGNGRVSGTGPEFRFREVPLVPAPRGRVPLWVAATSVDTAEVAAHRGLPLLLGMQDDPAAKKHVLDGYAVAAQAAGHDPANRPHASAHLAYVADGKLDEFRAALCGWLARTGEYQRLDNTAPVHRDLDAYARRLLDIHPVGSAQVCAERLIDAVATTGVRRLLLVVEAAGSRAATLDMIDRLASDVLPAVRAAASTMQR